MKVNLTRSDLISLVKGTEPYYSIFENPLVKRCGSYCGGFNDRWDWNYSFDDNITDEELWGLYNLCKNSWINI